MFIGGFGGAWAAHKLNALEDTLRGMRDDLVRSKIERNQARARSPAAGARARASARARGARARAPLLHPLRAHAIAGRPRREVPCAADGHTVREALPQPGERLGARRGAAAASP